MGPGVLPGHLEKSLRHDEGLVRASCLVDVPLGIVHLQFDALDVQVRRLVPYYRLRRC
mgnify:CR=1 FL=1